MYFFVLIFGWVKALIKWFATRHSKNQPEFSVIKQKSVQHVETQISDPRLELLMKKLDRLDVTQLPPDQPPKD